MMDFYFNIPFFCIILSMFSGIVSSALNDKNARRLSLCSLSIIGVLSAFLLRHMNRTQRSYTYMMGHFPAPWGNEIRVGVLEALMALFFTFIMFLCLIGGMNHFKNEIEKSKQNLYFVLIDLLLSSLLALIYTNDMFTAYVFIEINTISACGLIMIRSTGRTILAAIRYMIFSLLGSGLFLIGISMLYDLTGHLLMENMRESIEMILKEGTYTIPLVVVIGLMSVGLAIKSALYPFHSWLPDAYGYSTTSSSAILSSLVSKGYIFLLIKIYYRVIGFEYICGSRIVNILFVFGVIGMIMGSVSAIKQSDIRKMIAYSSVAQIGYIFMGIGLGSLPGLIASVFHIMTHAATKSLLFVSASGLTDVSGNSKEIMDLKGAAYRNKIAGVGFAVGSFSMVGLPLLSGFISKILFANAALQSEHKMLIALIALAISTVLNAVYFLRVVIHIYMPSKNEFQTIHMRQEKKFSIAILFFCILNFGLGICSQPILNMIHTGLNMFG